MLSKIEAESRKQGERPRSEPPHAKALADFWNYARRSYLKLRLNVNLV